jgi:hypothetical protein
MPEPTAKTVGASSKTLYICSRLMKTLVKVIYNSMILSHHPISNTRFENIVRKEHGKHH